jgi:hypothetical protein
MAMNRWRAPIATLAFGAIAIAASCKDRNRGSSSEPAVPIAAPTPTGSAHAAPTADEAAALMGVHGINKKRAHPVFVYRDGEPIAVMRAGEMPPELGAWDNAYEGQAERRYHRLAEYLEKIGVPLARVRTIHFAGHRDHVASLEGAELRKEPHRFVFHFGHKMTAMPKSAWSTVGLKNPLRIDTIRNVAIFVKKAPPPLDGKQHCYLDASRHCAPAYDPEAKDSAKGTRVYVDGRLAGYVKRRALGDALVVRKGDDDHGPTVYSLGKYLASVVPDLGSAPRVDFLLGDDVIARADGGAFVSPDLTFSLVRHGHGRMTARLPAASMAQGAAQSGNPPPTEVTEREVPVTAIQVYRAKAPSGRPLVPVDDQSIWSASRLGAQQDAADTENEQDI